MGMDDVGPPAVHHRRRAARRGGVEPVAVVILFDAAGGADPVHSDAVNGRSAGLPVGETEPDRARQHLDPMTRGGDVVGDATQLEGGAAREVGRVVGGHVEDAHRLAGPTVPGAGTR
jgi:hypothetical protein